MAFAELEASGSQQAPIELKLTWESEQKTQQQTISINPMEIEVVRPPVSRVAVVSYSILKDLGIPLIVGILAYLFQQALQERSKIQAVRNALLPTATTNAVKYLLPVAGSIRNLKRAVAEASSASSGSGRSEKQQEGFFYFVFTFKRMRDLLTVGGGFFFDNIPSEELADECWRAVRRRALEVFGSIDLSHTLDLMEGHETISLFFSQFPINKNILSGSLSPAQRAAVRVWEKFPSWVAVGPPNPDLEVLSVLGDVMQSESNRLFLGWYERVDRPSARDIEAWRQNLQAFQAAYPSYPNKLGEKLDNFVRSFPLWTRLLNRIWL
ncbi:MAG TPA: hypothetical protein VGM86_11200 [Thermoanaerobaculia bacterium]|jgi:hypothetical protein